METIVNSPWKEVCKTTDLIDDGGVCVLIDNQQIAIYKTFDQNYFATQNLCPHKNQMVLSRGMLGSQATEPKIACPFHKKTFSLISGKCLSGEDYKIKTYPIKIVGDDVFISLD